VDAKDPSNPTLVKQLKTSAYGGFFAGPVQAVGDLLVVMNPKNKDGIATLDISDPANPQLLTSKITGMTSYIGGFFGGYVFMLEPARAYDVTSNPLAITQVGPNMGCKSKAGCDLHTPDGEYMNFSDNVLYMGQVRNTSLSGATLFDFTKLFDPASAHDYSILRQIDGRRSSGNTIDDQFNLRLGSLLVLSDDELANRIGSVITVQDTEADKMPPTVHYTNPKSGATGQDVRSRIGISFSDLIEIATVNAASLIVRPMGGQPIGGTWNYTTAVVNFTPDQPLTPGTTYEVVIPKAGIADLVGNTIAEEFRATFTTK
jgi:Bacterial Ig-like domain